MRHNLVKTFLDQRQAKKSGMEIFIGPSFEFILNFVLLFLIDIVMLFYFQERYLYVVIIGGNITFTSRQLIM